MTGMLKRSIFAFTFIFAVTTFCASAQLSTLEGGRESGQESPQESLKTRQLGLQDWRRTEAYYQECLSIKSWVVSGQYQAECYTNYHHFNSGASRYYEPLKRGPWVEMAAFNLWHPGSNSSPYKDYELVAGLMNGYDVIAAMELLPSVGRDYEHNQRVRRFVESAPDMIMNLESRYQQSPSADIAQRIVELKSDLKEAPSLYRIPDYLVLLNELRKLDPSWALILAPSGEAADEAYVQELVGFYYRGRSVKPTINEHCHKFRKKRHGPSFACYPKLTKSWLGTNVREVFSRRPFLGSFVSGSFDFTLLTSHIVFTSPTDEVEMRSILEPSFGVSHYDELGTGATKANYARLAEMKAITNIMSRIRSESKEKDIIFLGDTNLEADNDQWKGILDSFSGGELFIDTPTTLTMPYRLSDGTLTGGLASDYDHIIMDTSETNECLKANGKLSPRVGNFLKGNMKKRIHSRYLYRRADAVPGMLESSAAGRKRRESMVKKYRARLEGRKTVKRNKIVADDLRLEELVREFDERVFLSQITEDDFYKVYKEVISDHLPVYFSCRNR